VLIFAASTVAARGQPPDAPAPGIDTLAGCVDQAIRACPGGVRSVTFTGGLNPSCHFECYPPPTQPTAPPPPIGAPGTLQSVLVWDEPVPHWEIDLVTFDGVWVTVSNAPGKPNDALWCQAMEMAGRRH
jgi:hypothetical protein